eukprot:CAMPEP_0171116950 /NCGR_PEP_ID=MMETSP0766_2-20121228/91430_1 /TAXON_ID=439317 /ORGANISM="Gambierdiscus australes, Strain CAWD 149" /LENGTH=82 /DNA_ID=CAMNT_0011579429 /DNA_START=12 /DNA_END=257 /DNA_ORIENTATION=+
MALRAVWPRTQTRVHPERPTGVGHSSQPAGAAGTDLNWASRTSNSHASPSTEAAMACSHTTAVSSSPFTDSSGCPHLLSRRL